MKIIGTGLSGLVGSRVTQVLREAFQFENLSLETGVDITQKDVVRDRVAASDAAWIFHFAAMTDLDVAEGERELGERSKTWIVNVEGTRHIVDAARAGGKRVLYLSTDFVFDGNDGQYSEEHTPNPQSWYAVTKYEAEKLVAALGDEGLILRIAFPYCTSLGGRPDFVHRIMGELRAGKTIESPNDQVFTPTLIDDVAHVIRVLVERNSSGIYHSVGSQALTPYDAAALIAQRLGIDASRIRETTWESYYTNRAPRPRHAVLKNDKIDALGILMTPFSEGIRVVSL